MRRVSRGHRSPSRPDHCESCIATQPLHHQPPLASDLLRMCIRAGRRRRVEPTRKDVHAIRQNQEDASTLRPLRSHCLHHLCHGRTRGGYGLKGVPRRNLITVKKNLTQTHLFQFYLPSASRTKPPLSTRSPTRQSWDYSPCRWY